jgi:hypothetical protein
MEIEELRIGNLVKNGLGEFIIIKNNINERNTGGYILKTLEPIPLTEEWLIKFGFIKGNHNWFRLYFNPEKLEDSDCLTYNINSKMLCLESFYCGEKGGSIQLLSLDEKYVHQLQNLYFALTGSELQYVA